MKITAEELQRKRTIGYIRFDEHEDIDVDEDDVERFQRLTNEYPGVDVYVDTFDPSNLALFVPATVERSMLVEIGAMLEHLGPQGLAGDPEVYEDEHGNVLIEVGLD